MSTTITDEETTVKEARKLIRNSAGKCVYAYVRFNINTGAYVKVTKKDVLQELSVLDDDAEIDIHESQFGIYIN